MREDKTIDLKIIRARDLPSKWLGRSSLLSFVLVTPKGDVSFHTHAVRGPNPEWNRVFIINDASLTSSIRLRVFHATNSDLIGQAEVSVDALLRDDANDFRCRLTKNTSWSFRRYQGELFISGNIHSDAGEAPEPESRDMAISSASDKDKDSDIDTATEVDPESQPDSAVSTSEAATDAFIRLTALPNVALVPPVEPTPQSLSAAELDQTQVGVNKIQTPSILKKVDSSAVGSVVDAVGSGILQDSGNVLTSILNSVRHLGDVFAEIHPYAKLVWTVFSGGYKILEAQIDRDERIRRLWLTVQDIVAFFKDVNEEQGRSDYFRGILIDAMKQIYECCQFLRKYAAHGFTGRTLRNALNPKNDDTVQLMINSFQTLREQLGRGVIIESWKYVRTLDHDLEEMKGSLKDLVLLISLDKPPGSIVECDTRRGCLAGTRTKLLSDITEWIHDPSRGRVLWLSGPVGTGKSSVANTIAGLFKGMGRLGASFCFEKQVDPSIVFLRIAHQLARIDKSLRDAIVSVLKQNIGIASGTLCDQALSVVVQPLRAVDLVGPVVIVIDALDEIGHHEERVRDDILAFFAREEFALPDYVKILITSRDDPHVRLQLESASASETLDIDDYEDTPGDIRLFIRHQLSEIRALTKLPHDWPPEGAIETLAERAGRQFLWAHITCQYIAESPRSRLAHILSLELATHDGTDQLDVLYGSVLQFAWNTRRHKKSYLLGLMYVLGCVAAGKDAFTLRDLNDFLGLRDDKLTEIHLLGHAPFYMEGAEQLISSVRPLFLTRSLGTLHLSHTSVFEFLTDAQRCPRFYIHLPYWNLVLAIRCLEILNDRLLHEAPVYDKNNGLVVRAISPALRYACRFFVEHIIEVRDKEHADLVAGMKRFADRNCLSAWVSVMLSLRLDWKKPLEYLIVYYKLPPSYKMLVSATSSEALAIMTALAHDSANHLAESISTADVEDEEDEQRRLVPSVQVLFTTVGKGGKERKYTAESDLEGYESSESILVTRPVNVSPGEPSTNIDIIGVEEPKGQPMIQGRDPNTPRTWFERRKMSESQYRRYARAAKMIRSAVTLSMESIKLADDTGFGGPVFSDAGVLLLEIWDALEKVPDPNHRFLGLVESCAQVLRAVCSLYLQGSTVTGVMNEAVDDLLGCFWQIHETFTQARKATSVQHSAQRSRTENKISRCTSSLSSIMETFQYSDLFHNIATLEDTSQMLLALQDTEHNSFTQGNLRALAQKVLTRWEMNSNAYRRETSLEDPQSSLASRLRDALTSSAPPPTASARVIANHELDFKNVIYRGPNGTVHRAIWDTGSMVGMNVAVKRFDGAYMSRNRFGNLVLRCWKLSDPNVLRLLGASSPADLSRIYTVTPYCEKGDLVHYLRSTPGIEEPELLQMMMDVVSGLEYLHKRGIAHGNLQGKNVLVESDSNCVIAGFNHSSLAYPKTDRQGQRIPYIFRDEMSGWYAPEVWDSADPFTYEADMYAVAIVCVEILGKGRSPWPPCTVEAMRAAVCEHKRPVLAPAALLREGLRSVIEHCWADDVGKRPTAGDARNRLWQLWVGLGYDNLD